MPVRPLLRPSPIAVGVALASAGAAFADATLDQLQGVVRHARSERGASLESFVEARRLLRLGQLSRALPMLQEAYRLGAPRARVDLALAVALLRSEQPREARFHAARAMESLGDDPLVYLVAGKAATALGDDQAAIDTYERALRQLPDEAELHFRLALAYDRESLVAEQVKNRLKALQHARRAWRLDPSYGERLEESLQDPILAGKGWGHSSPIVPDSRPRVRAEVQPDRGLRSIADASVRTKVQQVLAHLRKDRSQPSAPATDSDRSEARPPQAPPRPPTAQRPRPAPAGPVAETSTDAGWLGATSK